MSIEIQMHFQEIMKVLNNYNRNNDNDPQNRRDSRDYDSDSVDDISLNFQDKLADIDKQIEKFFEVTGLALI